MTPREAFKLGFRQKCAADGLSDEETLERIRHAKFMLGDEGLQKEAIWPSASNGFDWSQWIAPPLLGIAGGGLLAHATNADYDVTEAKKREELAEYQRALKAMQQVHERQHGGEQLA